MATNISKFRLQVLLDWIFDNSDDFTDAATRFKGSNVLLVDKSFTDGTGSNQLKFIYRDERTLAATTNDDLDLYGSLIHAFGLPINMVKLKMFFLENTSTTAADKLEIGAAGANPVSTIFGDTSDKKIVGPGGVELWTNPIDGYAITSGTADILRIRNPGANEITYNLYLAGTV
jgi:hypothetical protein